MVPGAGVPRRAAAAAPPPAAPRVPGEPDGLYPGVDDMGKGWGYRRGGIQINAGSTRLVLFRSEEVGVHEAAAKRGE